MYVTEGLPFGVYSVKKWPQGWKRRKGWKKMPFVNRGKYYLNQVDYDPHDLIPVCARATCFFEKLRMRM